MTLFRVCIEELRQMTATMSPKNLSIEVLLLWIGHYGFPTVHRL
jgi:hypothetical protein